MQAAGVFQDDRAALACQRPDPIRAEQVRYLRIAETQREFRFFMVFSRPLKIINHMI
jgi:hypothetical protein